jgi:hypothetical protein
VGVCIHEWLVLLGSNEGQYMSFEVGETVVYPHHGAALIEAIETRLIRKPISSLKLLRETLRCGSRQKMWILWESEML